MSTTLDSPVERRRQELRTPSQWNRLRELRLGFDLPVFALRSPELLFTPRGDGRITLFVPGFKTTDRSLLPIRTYLGQRGHDAREWGLGVNTGEVEELLDRTKERVVALAKESGRPINIVGWSLGGVYAREAARDLPSRVHRVATFGTPLFGPRHTAGSGFYSDDQLAFIEEQIEERADRPIERPLLTIYSRNDGVVDWRACPDEESPDVRNVEVSSGHIGMGIDPLVWREVAEFLAA
ncbi:MAG: alpha/beta hydrolase [Actinomycetota bacterium]